MLKAILLSLAIVFSILSQSVWAEEMPVEEKFPKAAQPYILPCYEKAQKYWDTGDVDLQNKGSEDYQQCLLEQIKSLTKNYFAGGEKAQKQFLVDLEDAAKKNKNLYDKIYLKNKWCGSQADFKKHCGQMDYVFSYGHTDQFLENVVISISATIYMKSKY